MYTVPLSLRSIAFWKISLATVLLVPLAAFAQEEVTVTEVMVWVKAIDQSGKPVAGLSQADFELFEDGKKMTPTCFEEAKNVFAQRVAPEESSESSPDVTAIPVRSKRVAVILDLYNTQQFEYLQLKTRIVELVNQLPPQWEVMIATIIPGSVQVNVPFGRDKKALLAEIDRITANEKRDAEVLDRRRMIMSVLDRGSRQAVEDAYRLAQNFAGEEMHVARESIKALEQFEKALVQWKTDSHMVVLYISGGINSEPGRQYFDIIDRRAGSRQPSLLGQRESGSHLWNLLRRAVARLNRHNITFYTINTRGVVNPAPDKTIEARSQLRVDDPAYLDEMQELMAELADQTGGLYFENSSNFGHGFDRILSDLDHQYLICYKAPKHEEAGESHKIKVTSKKPGLKLRHRTVYED